MTIAPLADEDSRPTPTLLTSASLQRLGVDFGAELLTGCARGSLAGSAGTRGHSPAVSEAPCACRECAIDPVLLVTPNGADSTSDR
jgi:hypothetical protein